MTTNTKATIWMAVVLSVIIGSLTLFIKEPEPPIGTDPPITLKAYKTDIIRYEKFNIPEKVTATSTKEAKTMVKYLYKSEKEVPQQIYLGLQEDMSMRTKSSISVLKSEIDGVKTYESKIFVDSEPFYPEDDKWYQTEIDVVPENVFDEAIKVSWWEKIIGVEVHATDSSIFVGGGDGVVGMNAETWANAHGASVAETTRNGVPDEDLFAYCFNNSGSYYLYRSLAPVPTGATITSGAFVTSSTLHFFVTELVDGAGANDYLALVETTQADETVPAAADFNEFGATTSPTTLSEDTFFGDMILNTWNSMVLNATGLAAIKANGDASTCGTNTGWTCLGARNGFDINDSACAQGEHDIRIRYSEYTGTASDPWLAVEWSMTPPAGPPDDSGKQNIIWYN